MTLFFRNLTAVFKKTVTSNLFLGTATTAASLTGLAVLGAVDDGGPKKVMLSVIGPVLVPDPSSSKKPT